MISQANHEGLKRERLVWTAALEQKIETDDQENRIASAIAKWLVDASLLGDVANLSDATEALRKAYVQLHWSSQRRDTTRLRTMLIPLAEVARASLDRARQQRLRETLSPDTMTARMLLLVDTEPGINSAELATRLGAESMDGREVYEVSDTLVAQGLLVCTPGYNTYHWNCTPRGRAIAEALRTRADV